MNLSAGTSRTETPPMLAVLVIVGGLVKGSCSSLHCSVAKHFVEQVELLRGLIGERFCRKTWQSTCHLPQRRLARPNAFSQLSLDTCPGRLLEVLVARWQ